MNNKTNYALVGLFVIAGFLLISLFVYRLAQSSQDVEMKRYAIYFDESVLGLNIDAPVKYRGISVGKVVKLGINPKNDEQVRVVVEVKKDTPIKTTTVAKLTAQGITGLSYINLIKGKNTSMLLQKVPSGEPYPVIKTQPSFFKSVETSVGDLYGRFLSTLENLNKILDKNNSKELHIVLHESANFFTKLNKALDNKTIKHFQNSLKHLDAISENIEKNTVPKINSMVDNTIIWEHNNTAAIQRIVLSYKRFEQMSESIKKAVQSGQFDVEKIAATIVPTLNKTLNSLDATIREMHLTVKEYKKSPRDILFKDVEQRKAPGER